MAHTDPHGPAHGSLHGKALNHETTDVSLTGTTRLAILSLAIIAVVMVLMYGAWGLFVGLSEGAYPPAAPITDENIGQREPPLPRLQSVPNSDLQRYRQQQEQRLTSYGWVDRSAGVVHMPIDRAMDLIAERADTIASPDAAGTPASTAPPTESAPPAKAADAPGSPSAGTKTPSAQPATKPHD